jgi:hypothetical protein
MKLIGLAGPAGVGKDTIADYLVERYNFTKFSFSDALYEEVATAFGMDKAALYERGTKEQETPALQYWTCRDKTFQNLMFHLLGDEDVTYPMDKWLSPRWVLQRWGTDYRRKQDSEYWIKKSMLFVEAYLRNMTENPDVQRGGLVNCSVRFENERAFVKQFNGEVWHVRRAGWDMTMGTSERTYVSEVGLSVLPEDKYIGNNGTIAQLNTGTSLLLGAPAGTSITCEPTLEPFNVTCENCGWVHMAYTQAQAAQEVAEYNEWQALNAASADLAATRPTKLDDYRGCNRCGGLKFRKSLEGDCPDGSTIGPVIYEPVQS